MILINNDEIIEIASSSNLNEEFQKYNFCSADIPFVEIVRVNGKSLKCILGYININTKEKIEVDIMIGHIKITKILVESQKETYSFSGLNDYNLIYNYSIHTITYNLEQEKKSWLRPYEYVFNTSQIVCYNNGVITSRTANPINLLFTKLVPEINSLIDKEIPTKHISYDYWDRIINPKVYEYLASLSVSLKSIFYMIYEMEVNLEVSYSVFRSDDITCHVRFKGEEYVLKNMYVANLLSTILNTQIVIEKNDNVYEYKGEIKEIPKYYIYDEFALKQYLQKKLYIILFLNYNQEKVSCTEIG